VESILSGGVVLGLSQYIPMFENKLLPMDPGDFILLYTDGATEAQDKAGEELGMERLTEIVEKYGRQNLTPQEIVASVFNDIKAFFSEVEQLDDITLLLARRNH
jgi:sigma-B regulation protein RsbU (phosphoserine phosphatase)